MRMPRPHRPRRIAHHGGERMHVLQHDAAGAHLRPLADRDRAQYLRPRADQHAAPDERVALPALLARATQGHALKQRDIVIDHRRLAHHYAGAMVEQDAAPHPRRRVDVHAEHLGDAALNLIGQMQAAAPPQPVAETIGLDGIIALEEQKRRQQVGAGRIAVAHRREIGQRRLLDVGIGRERLAADRLQRLHAQRVIGQLARQPVRQRIAEIVVDQHGVADDFAHHPVALDRGHRLFADLHPKVARHLAGGTLAAGARRCVHARPNR